MQLDGLKEGYQQILKDKNSTQEERNEARQAIDQIDNAGADASTILNIAEGNARNYGAFAPRLTNDGKVVAGGGTLNDGDLWGMNYYVQGVIGKIPN